MISSVDKALLRTHANMRLCPAPEKDFVGCLPMPQRHGSDSDEPSFRKRYADPVADDDVIQEANVDQGERFLHALGDEVVRLARFRDS